MLLWVSRSGGQERRKGAKYPRSELAVVSGERENLGNRGGTEGRTAGPTAARGWDVGPGGSLESQPEPAFMSVFAKCGVCGVCGIWVEGRGPWDLSQPLPPAHFPTLIAHPGRAGPG